MQSCGPPGIEFKTNYLKCHETPLFHFRSEKGSRNGCGKLWKSGSVGGENNQ